MQAIEVRDGRVHLRVRVQPKASRNAFRIEPDGRLRVALTAPPVEGAANKALRAFVAKSLGLAKSSVTLTTGAKSRDKVLRLEGTNGTEVEEALRGLDSGT